MFEMEEMDKKKNHGITSFSNYPKSQEIVMAHVLD